MTLDDLKWVFSGVGVVGLVWLARRLGDYVRSRRKIAPDLKRFTGYYKAFLYVQDRKVARFKLQIFLRKDGSLGVTVKARLWHLLGSLKVSHSTMFFHLSNPKQDVDTLWIFREPLGDFNRLPGVYCAQTIEAAPIAGYIAIERTDQITWEEAPLGLVDIPNAPEQIGAMFDLDTITAMIAPSQGEYHASEANQ